jgi:hypothetical protein
MKFGQVNNIKASKYLNRFYPIELEHNKVALSTKNKIKSIFDLSMYDWDHGNFFYQLKYIQF